MKAVAAVFCAALLTGCAGYQIGSVKPHYLGEVQSIAIPTFSNRSLVPRVETLVTSSVIKQFQQDGTFRIANEKNADAVLKGEIRQIARVPARSVRGNVLATTEFNLVLRVRYSLVARNGATLNAPTEVQGTTNYFVGRDVITDERQALPLAAEELATRLVSHLSEGW